MNAVLVIAGGAFREAVRSKVFLNLLALLGVIVVAGVTVESIAIGEAGRIFFDITHAAVSLSGSLVALFVAIQLVANDIERKTLHILLARPVTRLQVVVGKYLGLAAVLGVNTLVAALIYALAAAPIGFAGVSGAAIVALLALYLQFLLVGAFAMLFSTMSTSTTAGIFSLTLYIVGRLGDELSTIAERSSVASAQQAARVMRVVLPDLTRFDLNPRLPLPATSSLALMVGYALCWALALLLVAAVVFGRRDLK